MLALSIREPNNLTFNSPNNSMSILTPEEIADGDKFFTDSNVQYNRALAGCDFKRELINEPGVIVSYGIDYTKVKTQYGEVCIPWQVTGSTNGNLGFIYNYIAEGVYVYVCAYRTIDKAYPWCGKNLSIPVTFTDPITDEKKYILHTAHYNCPGGFYKYCVHVVNDPKKIGKIIGKNGMNLRKIMEDNNMDNTYITFKDYPDGAKYMFVKCPKAYKEIYSKIIDREILHKDILADIYS